jgi:hypothetical protein
MAITSHTFDKIQLGTSEWYATIKAEATVDYDGTNAIITVTAKTVGNLVDSDGKGKGWVQSSGCVVSFDREEGEEEWQSLIGNTKGGTQMSSGTASYEKIINRFTNTEEYTAKINVHIHSSSDMSLSGKHNSGTKKCQKITLELPIETITSVGAPKITITDLGNNNFRINVTPGAAGTNNPVTGVSNLYYGYDEASINKAYSNGSDILLPEGSVKDSRTIYATATTTGTYNSVATSPISKVIYQYFEPGQADNLAISCDETSNKLTLSKDWVLTWSKPEIANEYTSWIPDYSYYQLCLYKNSEAISQLGASGENGSCEIIQNSENKNNYINLKLGNYTDLQKETINITISSDTLKSLGFVTGDIVSFSITSVTKWGTRSSNDRNFQSWSWGDTASSENYKISGGVVHIKVNDIWKEGQVYVKVGNDWKEAEGVYVKKTSTDWVEST